MTKKLSYQDLQFIVSRFDTIYEDFANQKSSIRLAKNDESKWDTGDKIKAILKSEERKPMAILKFISRKKKKWYNVFQKELSVSDTSKAIDISCGLVFSILTSLDDGLERLNSEHVMWQYMYIKLTLAACNQIIWSLKNGISKEILECHFHHLKICEMTLTQEKESLEKVAELSEQFNSIIEILTNKVCMVRPKIRKDLFDIDEQKITVASE
jgi:hypothetical protein